MQKRRERALNAMFETRSEAWAAVGLDLKINENEIKSAQRRLALTIPLLIATIVAKSMALHHWESVLFNWQYWHSSSRPKGWRQHHLPAPPHYWLVNSKSPFEILAVIIVLILGWLISRDLGRMAPGLFRRMDPATAGTVGFMVRLVAVAATVLGAINIAGVSAQVVAVGGAFTAVVVGLAAQQTLGNLFAGMVLLSAQPFRMGERVRLYAGAIGEQEGTVSSLGLLYTSLSRGVNRIMIPNTLVLSAVVMPLREPPAVDVRVKLQAGVKPSQAQAILDAELGDTTSSSPSIVLEEIDGDSVTIRVHATPENANEGARLADDIITVLASVTGTHETLTEGRD